jgi:hypothetical protein
MPIAAATAMTEPRTSPSLVSLYCVGNGARDDERQGLQSFAGVRLAARVTAANRQTVLLVDDADDVLNASGPHFGNGHLRRRTVHDFLETCPVPIIWTVNDTTCVGQSVIRRMADAIEMKLPPFAARRRITERVLTQAGLPRETSLVEQLALSAAPPAVIAKAVGLAGRSLRETGWQ